MPLAVRHLSAKVEEQFLEQRGRLEVTNCGILGFGDGGAVRAEAYMGYGEARFEGCFADHGGAMSLEELRRDLVGVSSTLCFFTRAGSQARASGTTKAT